MRKKTAKKRPQRQGKGKRGRKPGEHWTLKMRKFCDGLAQGMTQTEAARYAGYANAPQEAVKLMGKRLIIQWRTEYEKMRRKATQNALNEDAREQVISRRKVEGRFADILLNGETESAQLKAGLAIMRMNGWLGDEVKNIGSRLNAKSSAEEWFIAMHGRAPADDQELQAFEESRGAILASLCQQSTIIKPEDAAKIQAMVADPLIWMQQYTKTKDSHWREHGAPAPIVLSRTSRTSVLSSRTFRRSRSCSSRNRET